MMSDDPSSNQGAASGSNIGGNRTPRQRSDKSQARRDTAIRATKETWGVSEYADIFPANIRPQGELGDSAIFNIRQLARKVPQLAAARLLMSNECIDTGGSPTRLSFKNTNNILVRLKEGEAREAAEKKLKDDKKHDAEDQAPGSPKNLMSSEPLHITKGAVVKRDSAPPRGSPGAKATKGAISSAETDNLAANISITPGKRSATEEKVVPAKTPLSGSASRLSKVKAPTPTTHLNQAGKLATQKAAHTSLMGDKNDSKEVTSDLLVPNVKDVAPFSGNKLLNEKKPSKPRVSLTQEEDDAIVKEQSPKKRVSNAVEEDNIAHISTVVKGPHWGQSESRVRSMTEDEGLPTIANTGNTGTSVKRCSDGGDEQPPKKFKLSKESVKSESNFGDRSGVEMDSHLINEEIDSEGETDIDIKSVLKLLNNKAAKKNGYCTGSSDPKDAGMEDQVKPIGELLGGRSVDRPADAKQVRKVLAHNPRESIRLPRPGVVVSTVYPEVDKKRKAPASNMESPASPRSSPDREESISSTKGRCLSDLHNSKRVKVTGNLSLAKEVLTGVKMSPENKSSELSIKTGQESPVSKEEIMDYNVNEAFEKAEEPSANSPKEIDPQLTPKAVTTTAKGITCADNPATPDKPYTTLPRLPENLTARVPADRALILSIPGIIKAYVKDLQAAIPQGKGPDGDLLSMIIVNKYGYFLDHVDKLDKDLVSLYSEAVDKDEEKERKEKERSL